MVLLSKLIKDVSRGGGEEHFYFTTCNRSCCCEGTVRQAFDGKRMSRRRSSVEYITRWT